MKKNNHIEICGNIASGKTTLCTLLATKGFTPVFERFEANPFFHQFYASPAGYAFETELTFSLQHYTSIKDALEEGHFVCDFSPTLDLAYADVNLSGDRLTVFKNVIESCTKEIGQPDVLIHLDCPEDILLERIRKRSRTAETSITKEYLTDLRIALCKRIKQASTKTHVITIDCADFDFSAQSIHPKLAPFI